MTELVKEATKPNNPELAGRRARCSYCKNTEPSSTALAFFEFCGEGSRHATEGCKCGYTVPAHTPEVMARNNRLTCTDFTPRGPAEFDRYYCGCRGFD